jgi:hypothetical protein
MKTKKSESPSGNAEIKQYGEIIHEKFGLWS